MAQLMPLPLTVSCFSKIQIGFTFLVPAYPGSPGKRAVKRVYLVFYVFCRFCGRLTLGQIMSTLVGCLVKVTNQGAAPDIGRSMMSKIEASGV